MEALLRRYLQRMVWVVVGIAFVVVGLLIVRVMCYESAELGAEMAPDITFFAPGMIAVIALVAGFFEAGLTKYWFAVDGRRKNFVLGVSYGSLVISILGPTAILLFIITNPIIVRWVMRRYLSNESSAV